MRTNDQWTPPAPGPWQQDQAHSPVATTAVMQEVYPDGFNRGFTECFGRYGLLLDRLAMASVNGFTYHQPQPFDLPGPDGPPSEEEIGRQIGLRTEKAAETFATRRWQGDLEHWDRDCKPEAIAAHRAFGDVDLGALDTAELVAHIEAVAAHVSEMVYQHHRFNMAAMLPVGDFALRAAEWAGRDPASLFAALDGYSPVSSVASDELTDVIRAVGGDPSLEDLVRGSGDPRPRLDELRSRCPAVDEYVRRTGFRIVEGFDVVAPTAAERPELVLGRIAAALDADPDAARGRADAFAAALRADVPEEHRDEFDVLLEDARSHYRLRDERGIYSDISAVGLLRWAMLEAGRRLAEQGTIEDPEHALEARLAELVGLLNGGDDVSGVELAERQALRIARTEAGAPRFLGGEPPEPPPVDQLPPPLARIMSVTGFFIEGILGQMAESTGTPGVVVGIPASAGSVEATARVVRGMDDLDRLEPGDVLVAPATGEAVNALLHLLAGIVTDHGSFASHAGIVGREVGIPAVVGTVDGTSRIPDGARVRIDGDRGEVTVLT